MPKYGISVRLDVTKIDKARLYKGAKGTYLDLTTFIDTDEKDQYDNNGFVTQSPTKEEREAKDRMPILGNVRVFYSGDSDGPRQEQKPGANVPADEYNDDIPF